MPLTCSDQNSLNASPSLQRAEITIKYRKLNPYTTGEINVLLLENISPNAVEIFKRAGFNVEVCKGSLPPAELKEKLRNAHAIGIRSKTQMTAEIIKDAPCLLTIGCFCIGTNQVDLDAALSKGISVFNSPFSNSRSVAELIIGEIITLARQLGDRNLEMHQGQWNKRSAGCVEIRGKVLGIVGYGHIGSQLSVLAEAMGMRVIFYDVAPIMPLGSATAMRSLGELLKNADFVTLHVPELPSTVNLIGERELSLMKRGSFLLNASRGSVVNLEALQEALESGHIAGAALDVFPREPEANGAFWPCEELVKFPNVLLTPHIGGSTEEAQAAIGNEVASAMVKFLNQGSSQGSVNFPEVDLRTVRAPPAGRFLCRLLNVHHNVPGVLKKINLILAEHNIEKQTCESRGPFSYVIVDVSTTTVDDLDQIFTDIYNLPESVATRLLY